MLFLRFATYIFSGFGVVLPGLMTWILIARGFAVRFTGILLIAFFAAVCIYSFFRLTRHPFLKTSKGPRKGVWIVFGLALPYFFLLLPLDLSQDKLLFPAPSRAMQECPTAGREGFQVVDRSFEGKRVRLYVRQNKSARGWVFIFHGNAEVACNALSYPLPFERKDLNFVLFEYPGYPPGAGKASEKSILESTLAAYDLVASENAKHLPIFALGRSLGTGIATYLASQRQVSGVILISPYTSIADVAQIQYPLPAIRLLVRNPFRAAKWARQVKCPAVILHGTWDHVIPTFIGKTQSRNFRNLSRFVEVPDAGHNDILSRGITRNVIEVTLKKWLP